MFVYLTVLSVTSPIQSQKCCLIRLRDFIYLFFFPAYDVIFCHIRFILEKMKAKIRYFSMYYVNTWKNQSKKYGFFQVSFWYLEKSTLKVSFFPVIVFVFTYDFWWKQVMSPFFEINWAWFLHHFRGFFFR
jgi:hypothetical protein